MGSEGKSKQEQLESMMGAPVDNVPAEAYDDSKGSADVEERKVLNKYVCTYPTVQNVVFEPTAISPSFISRSTLMVILRTSLNLRHTAPYHDIAALHSKGTLTK